MKLFLDNNFNAIKANEYYKEVCANPSSLLNVPKINKFKRFGKSAFVSKKKIEERMLNQVTEFIKWSTEQDELLIPTNWRVTVKHLAETASHLGEFELEHNEGDELFNEWIEELNRGISKALKMQDTLVARIVSDGVNIELVDDRKEPLIGNQLYFVRTELRITYGRDVKMAIHPKEILAKLMEIE